MTAIEEKVFITIAELSGPSLDGQVEFTAIAQALNISEQDLDAAIDTLSDRHLINVGVQSYARLNDNGRSLYRDLAQ